MSNSNDDKSENNWLETARAYVRKALDEARLTYTNDVDTPQRFILPYSSKTGYRKFKVFIFLEADWIGVIAAPELKVPPKSRKSVAELLDRINFITRPGRFSVDFQDGEIRIDQWLYCHNCLPVPEVLLASVQLLVTLFEAWADGFLDAIGQRRHPEDIFQDIFSREYQKNTDKKTKEDSIEPKLPAGTPILNDLSSALNAPMGETPDLNYDTTQRPIFNHDGPSRHDFDF